MRTDTPADAAAEVRHAASVRTTPGPWAVGSDYKFGVYGPDDRLLASVVREDDVTLIAAAPTLAEALRCEYARHTAPQLPTLLSRGQ